MLSSLLDPTCPSRRNAEVKRLYPGRFGLGLQAVHSFDLLGKKHKCRRVNAEEEKWRTATSAYEDQKAKIEGLRSEVSKQIHLTRDLRWKVDQTIKLAVAIARCMPYFLSVKNY